MTVKSFDVVGGGYGFSDSELPWLECVEVDARKREMVVSLGGGDDVAAQKFKELKELSLQIFDEADRGTIERDESRAARELVSFDDEHLIVSVPLNPRPKFEDFLGHAGFTNELAEIVSSTVEKVDSLPTDELSGEADVQTGKHNQVEGETP